MRKEASLEQWRILYETATRIKELKPWEKFWDMDLIGIRNGVEEDNVFSAYSVVVGDVMEYRYMKDIQV